MSSLEGASGDLGAPDVPASLDLPHGSSNVVPIRAGSAAPPPRSGAEYPAGTPRYLSAPPAPTTTGLRWDNPGARYRKSAMSFGIVGRVVTTVILVLVLLWVCVANVFVVPLYLIVIVWALRDTWVTVPVRAPVPMVAPRGATRGTASAAPGVPIARPVYDPIPRRAPDDPAVGGPVPPAP
jgi:hypothetical protein